MSNTVSNTVQQHDSPAAAAQALAAQILFAAEAGEYRLFGPPGTGKTMTVSLLIQELAGNPVGANILLTSFTKAAARELAARAGYSLERAGTLHAFAYRLLENPQIADERISEFNKSEFGVGWMIKDGYGNDGNNSGAACYADLQRMRNTRTPIALWRPQVRRFSLAWNAWKEDMALRDYTDLLTDVIDRRLAPDASCIVVDEAQDCTALELAMVRGWASLRNVPLVLVGDDDQTLYEFKGASPEAFAGTRLPGGHTHVLSVSGRLPGAVACAGEAITGMLSFRQEKHFTTKKTGGVVEMLPYTSKKVLSIVTDLVGVSSMGLSVMFLASAHYQLTPVLEELRKAGIPFHNPYSARRDWNPLTAKDDEETKLVRALTAPYAKTRADVNAIFSILKVSSIFKRGGLDAWNTRCVNDAAQNGTEDGLWFLWEYVHDQKLLAKVILGESLEHIEARASLVKAEYQSQLEYLMRVIHRNGVDAVKATPQIIVGTIHSVKGGEADHVMLLTDLPPAFDPAEDATLRMLYVAITRAREGVHYIHPSTPSHFDLRLLQKGCSA